ncbi:hypothetical protein [Burkholderia alba]|uniref:hypothetical protein n=1 Tax=Burkholderia alba TaxID=2683677 RepID=UPI002B056DA4|nr:hypothetical protein [Burkholderia alba]
MNKSKSAAARIAPLGWIAAAGIAIAARGVLAADTAVPLPDTTPWLASVVAGNARVLTQTDADDTSPRFRDSGHTIAQGSEVVVGESAQGDLRLDGKLYATYIGPHGVATAGWIERTALRRIAPAPIVPAGWDGRWRSSDHARQLIVRGDRASYAYLSDGAPPVRLGMLLRFKQVSEREAKLSRAQMTDGTCDLDLQRLRDYLVVVERDCFIGNASPAGILRRQR